MKTWLMELCPEIAEWQAEAIEEYHKSAVKLAREAVVQELVGAGVEPAMHMIVDMEGTVALYYNEFQLAGAVARERERCAEKCDEVARKYGQQHNASAENIADECAAAIRGQT